MCEVMTQRTSNNKDMALFKGVIFPLGELHGRWDALQCGAAL
jgi:hypothetical protein